MDLSRELQTRFGPAARTRGRMYFDGGRVRIVACAPDRVEAVVTGSELYEVRLRRHARAWALDCECPAFLDQGPCKHLWATILAADETLARGGGSPAALWDGSTEPSAPSVPASAPQIDPLEELRRASARASSASSSRLRFVLHVETRADAGAHQLDVQTMRASRGELAGTWRTALPRSSERPLEPAIEDLLGRLRGALPFSHYDELTASSARYVVPAHMERELLGDMAKLGLLHLSFEGRGISDAIGRDLRGEWSLSLAVSRTPAGTRLDAVLARGDERLPLASIEIAFESGAAIARGKFLDVDWRGAWSWVATLRKRSPIELPRSRESELLDLLTRAPGDPRIEAPAHLLDVGGAPTFVLQVSAPDEDGSVVCADLAFEYGGLRVRRGRPAGLTRRGEQMVRVIRDDEAERRAEAEFTESGGALDAERTGGHDGTITAATLPDVARLLNARGWIVEAEGRPLRTGFDESISVRSGLDWFDLRASIDFGGVKAELPELLRALRERTVLVRLADGGVGVLPEAWLARWQLALALGEDQDGAVRVTKARAWMLDALLAEQSTKVDVDAGFARVRESLERARDPQPMGEPAGFHGELRPYQREGLGWLSYLGAIGLGGCLADDMGLGKTVQVLALILERREKARGPALVVAPLSLVFNWQREAERFTPTLEVLVHHGPSRTRKHAALEDADIVLTTYGTMRADVKMLAGIDLDMAVLDEAQAIKNQETQAARAVRLLKADLRLALTGTPVENRIEDIVSIFEFLNPGLVSGSRALREVLSKTGDELDTARRLSRALRPFLLRRTKEQVLPDLPPRSEQVLVCELEGDQRRLYDELKVHYRNVLLKRVDEEGLEGSRMHVLEALLRLRQAACHPGLIDPSRTLDASAKLDALIPMLEELTAEGHKALVFSQFTSFLALLRARLDPLGVRYEYLDGKTKDREMRVKTFQEDATIPLFLIGLKAGGFGLNLTAADYVFLLDPWWNPATERQAIDRTHRIGQTRSVTAYRLVARGTVEDKVLELQEKKKAVAEALFEGGATSLRDLSRDDLAWILS